MADLQLIGNASLINWTRGRFDDDISLYILSLRAQLGSPSFNNLSSALN